MASPIMATPAGEYEPPSPATFRPRRRKTAKAARNCQRKMP